jgi:hypothetical protein
MSNKSKSFWQYVALGALGGILFGVGAMLIPSMAVAKFRLPAVVLIFTILGLGVLGGVFGMMLHGEHKR